MTAPVRVQLKRQKGWKMPPNTVNCARPGPWGNYAGPTRKDFEDDLACMSNADKAFFMDKVRELRGKNLACWCAVGQPCHADVLLALANDENKESLT
jgi:hypothetical protein